MANNYNGRNGNGYQPLPMQTIDLDMETALLVDALKDKIDNYDTMRVSRELSQKEHIIFQDAIIDLTRTLVNRLD